ncbi:MAG: hypothetical protein L0G27_06860 [Paracoccus sp. (in: a-proteobacteria)]|nr:hypothetical protein [Paracoccus sp. (in: a-proteobacteria)]
MGAREDLIAIPDEVYRVGKLGQAALVFMDFQGAPKRWWAGFGDIAVGGHTWQGVGDLISISEIATSYSVSAEAMTFQLAATPEMLALALAAKTRVRDRQVQVLLQLYAMESFTAAGVDYAEGQAIASPFSLYNGTMQKMPWSASGADQRTITLECEGHFFRRNAPPRGNWNDADQKARYPGDRGFERLPLYTNGYEAKWR